MRVIGASLVAFSDATKRATTLIDLKKVTAVADDRELAQNPGAEAKPEADDSNTTRDVKYSFRLIFPNEEEIAFFADTDKEKARWCDVSTFRCDFSRRTDNFFWSTG